MVLVVWFIIRTGSCCSFRYLSFIINWSDTSTFYWYNLFCPDILWTTMIRFLFQLSTFWGLKLPSYWHSTPKTMRQSREHLSQQKRSPVQDIWAGQRATILYRQCQHLEDTRPVVKIICWRANTARLFFYSDVTKMADQALPTSVPLQRSIRQLSRNKNSTGRALELKL